MVLKYIEFGLSHMEVPNESCLCIYISGCPNKCNECHYPELQSPSEGECLCKYFDDIIDLYIRQTTCVCFMGEGDCTKESREEMMLLVKKVKEKGLKSCLYSGRDCSIEDWMEMFDYIKLGSYKKEYGDLFEETTNQRMYMKTSTGYQNITNMFRYL